MTMTATRGAALIYDVGHGDRGASKTPAARVRLLHVVPASTGRGAIWGDSSKAEHCSCTAGIGVRVPVAPLSCLRMHLVKQPDCRSGEGSSILLGGAGGPK